MTNDLADGTVRVGYITDDIAAARYEPCVLQMEDDGLRARVPVLYGGEDAEQNAADGWRRARKVPTSLLFSDNEGSVVLHDTRWRGTRDGMVGAALDFDAEVAILGQPQAWPVRKEVEELRSKFDGLDHFKFFARVSHEYVEAHDGRTTTVEVAPAQHESWIFKDIEYSLDGEAPWRATDGRSFSVETETWLRTTSTSGLTVQEHLRAQWSVRALVALAQGQGLYWRKHVIADPGFDHPAGRIHHEVQLRQTARDRDQPVARRAVSPLFTFDDLRATGMVTWLTLLEDETFRRAIDPAAESLTDRPKFVEVRVLLGIMALDAMGQFHQADGARHMLFENLEQCLDKSGIDWSPLGAHPDLASALSALNNDVKHADRSRADVLAMVLADDLLLALMRSQLFDVLGLPATLKAAFANSFETKAMVARFAANNVGIDGTGKNAKFIRLP